MTPDQGTRNSNHKSTPVGGSQSSKLPYPASKETDIIFFYSGALSNYEQPKPGEPRKTSPVSPFFFLFHANEQNFNAAGNWTLPIHLFNLLPTKSN